MNSTNTSKVDSFYKPRLNRSTIPIVLWNLTPVLGVLLLHWKPENIFVCYALETIVVGVFNIFKLLVVYKRGLPPKADETGLTGIALIPFFIFHYYFFVFVQLSLFFGSSSFPLGLPKTILAFALTRTGIIALAIFISNNLFLFISNFLQNKECERVTMAEQMFEPYPRIFVQQFVVILGGMFFRATGSGWILLIIFVGIKTYLDLVFSQFSIRELAEWQKEQEKNAEK